MRTDSYGCRRATRVPRGKNEARRTRRAGMIPAVLYGAYKDRGIHCRRSQKHSARFCAARPGTTRSSISAIEGGENTPVMVVDGQCDPIRGNLLHADLKRIDLDQAHPRFRPGASPHGEATGIKLQGGLLEVISREVEIECLPDEIPEHFTVDVTELDDRTKQARRRYRIDGLDEAVEPAEAVIAHVVVVKRGGRAHSGGRCGCRRAGGRKLAAEPEVIKKGKKEEEEPAAGQQRARRSKLAMFLVAGLGNPGEEYDNSPHNLGFLRDRPVGGDAWHSRHTARIRRRLMGVGAIAGQPVMLAKPQTFMNLSGALRCAADGEALS